MLCFNRGEWSEIYTVLYLLANPDIKRVNSNLDIIDDKTLKINEIFLGSDTLISYRIVDNTIYRLYKNQIQCEFSCFEIQAEVDRLLRDITLQKGDAGAFELPERRLFFNRFIGDFSFKAKATDKSDISINLFDCDTPYLSSQLQVYYTRT